VEHATEFHGESNPDGSYLLTDVFHMSHQLVEIMCQHNPQQAHHNLASCEISRTKPHLSEGPGFGVLLDGFAVHPISFQGELPQGFHHLLHVAQHEVPHDVPAESVHLHPAWQSISCPVVFSPGLTLRGLGGVQASKPSLYPAWNSFPSSASHIQLDPSGRACP